MSVRGIGINNSVAMIVRIIFILLALWIEGVGLLEIIWSILEIIWSMADIISAAAAAAAATAAAAEAETEASTTILSVNILYLRAALTCRDWARPGRWSAGCPRSSSSGASSLRTSSSWHCGWRRLGPSARGRPMGVHWRGRRRRVRHQRLRRRLHEQGCYGKLRQRGCSRLALGPRPP